jgi:hypothetical protein
MCTAAPETQAHLAYRKNSLGDSERTRFSKHKDTRKNGLDGVVEVVNWP